MEENSKTKTQIKELMGLVSRYGNLNYQECDADYREHLTRSELYAKDQRDTYAAIESKLRAMLERKPLTDEQCIEILKFGKSSVTMARAIERAHGINGE